MPKKKEKEESMEEWSRRVFGYTKDGWLYVDNKRVSYVGPDEDEFDETKHYHCKWEDEIG